MKYCNLHDSLIIQLIEGLAVACSIRQIEINGRHYERIVADFAFPNQISPDEAFYCIPLSRQVASSYFLRMRERECLYRNACEVWWSNRLKKSSTFEETIIISDSLLKMIEQDLDLPKPVKVEKNFWRKPNFVFSLS
jgi:hypothetical protein